MPNASAAPQAALPQPACNGAKPSPASAAQAPAADAAPNPARLADRAPRPRRDSQGRSAQTAGNHSRPPVKVAKASSAARAAASSRPCASGKATSATMSCSNSNTRSTSAGRHTSNCDARWRRSAAFCSCSGSKRLASNKELTPAPRRREVSGHRLVGRESAPSGDTAGGLPLAAGRAAAGSSVEAMGAVGGASKSAAK